jgi:hypothetical protein
LIIASPEEPVVDDSTTFPVVGDFPEPSLGVCSFAGWKGRYQHECR